MSLSTKLAFRPRPTATSPTVLNNNPPAPSPPYQLRIALGRTREDILSDLRSQMFKIFEKLTIHSHCNDKFYYTYVVDEYLRVRYTSLGQESAEKSLKVVLELLIEDVMAKEEKEGDDGQSEDEGDEEEGDIEDEGGEDYEEFDEMDMD